VWFNDVIINKRYELNLIIKFIRKALPQQVLDLAIEFLKLPEYFQVELPNVYTLVNGNGSFIDLLDINNYVGDNRNKTCNQVAISIINRFSKEKLAWESELKQLKKRDKFNDCEVKYDATQDEGIHVNRSIQQQPNRLLEQKRFYGWLAELARELTNMHNFNIFFFDRVANSDYENELVRYHENSETDSNRLTYFRSSSDHLQHFTKKCSNVRR